MNRDMKTKNEIGIFGTIFVIGYGIILLHSLFNIVGFIFGLGVAQEEIINLFNLCILHAFI